MQQQLTIYLRAGYAGLAIVTAEEVRAEAEIAAACTIAGHHLHAWSSSEGLVDTRENRISECPDPLDALQLIERLFSQEEIRHVVVMRDLQLHLDQTDPVLVRRLKDLLRVAKAGGHALILLGCRLKLPAELDHEITRLDFDLPDAAQLTVVLDGIIASAGLKLDNEVIRQGILNAALGLTTIEAENVFALSVAESGGLDHRIISREKARALKRNGLVEVVETKPSLDDIGGLDLLKEWLVERSGAFSPAAKTYGIPAPKGLLIVGIPGTGKSLTAKATATAFGMPLLRLDMGRVFGGIVGQSEANLRSVIQTAEAIAPCVLWIDEIEKGFSGSQSSGSSDGGTSSRVFGSFLSWMQEQDKPVFVVATANDVSKLPSEFLRKGRFDELFFVDLPDALERAQIWDIVIRKYGRRETDYDTVVLARATEQHTGAEIEAIYVAAMHEAFAKSKEPSAKDIVKAMADIVPLAQLMDGQISALRHWAKGRAREAATRHAPPRQQRRRVGDLN
jgi:AAA+ superfamily predicted ATPase